MEKLYNISVFTENHIGLLNRITVILTRRHLNIESLTTSESELEGVFRYTIVIKTTREQVDKVVKQIEKLIDVLKAFVYEDEDVVFQELALYKVGVQALLSGELEKIIRHSHARILHVTPDYVIIEKTGYREETQQLLSDLETFGVLEFSRSGRVVITKPMATLSNYLKNYH
jgi:acetolactate synthase-1/3 small subunit